MHGSVDHHGDLDEKSENGYISSYSKYKFRDNFIGDFSDLSFSNRLVPQLK